ncbi:type II secretion system protein GspM, partial [Sandarakinorhabdus rubra]|uniref:type II secretion system protein GspM n=1 Tax=Sandarakinorhabdus rubra TaxID=2672568 RepID=UPI00196A1614
ARLAQVRAAAAAIAASPAATAAPLPDLIGRRLAEAGLQPSRLEAQGGGQAVVEIAAVNGRLLLGWAAALEERDGLVIDTLSASRNADQSVKARLVVRRAG